MEGAISAAGTGIAFPATQLPSTNPNTLDDYEEGTWTPSLGGTATYTTQQGRYLKIGKQVTVIGEIQVNTLGTGSTNSIFGLPFNPVSVSGSGIFGTGACFFQSISGTAATMTASVAPGVSWVTLYTTTWAVANMTAPTVFTNGTRVSFTITYETA